MIGGLGQEGLRNRARTYAALAVPCAAGLIYLLKEGAPAHYVAINSGALLVALVWIALGRFPADLGARRAISIGLIGILALPLVIGPEVSGVTRWLSLAGITLHVGMVIIPALAVLASSDELAGPALLLAAILIAFMQPDSASTLALTCAALAVALARRSGTFGWVAALGLFATIGASFNGNLPPQPFVEHILSGLWVNAPWLGLMLSAGLLAGLGLIMILPDRSQASRLALVSAMAGFILAACLASYPYPLIGYGAASILGLGLALGRPGKER